jgi:hypothetical protein
VTVTSAPVGENQTNDTVTPRTCDSAKPSAAGYLCQEDHHVKRVPIKAPMSRLHKKISHFVLVQLSESEKQKCLIRSAVYTKKKI